jgi:LysR family nitrogen assimilation transcriptional regulator
LEHRHLRNFLAVVEQRSISKAARLIRLAQPALSRQLRALEDELGTPLLFRHGSGVIPTPPGEILAKYARSLLDQAQAVRDAISAVASSPTGKLAIGAPSSMAAILIPELALAVRRRLPGVQLRLIEGYSANLHQRLLAGELDVAILYAERRQTSLVTRPLLSEPLVAIGPAGHFSARKSVSIPELAAQDLIMPAAANRLRSLFEDAAAQTGHTATIVMEVDSVPGLLELVAAGAGVSILPYSAIHSAVKQGRLSYARIAPETFDRHLVLARIPERIETPLWSSIVELLCDLLRSKEREYRWTVA